VGSHRRKRGPPVASFLSSLFHRSLTVNVGGLPDSMQTETYESSFSPWSRCHDHCNTITCFLEIPSVKI
jgi:hypothetical protein